MPAKNNFLTDQNKSDRQPFLFLCSRGMPLAPERRDKHVFAIGVWALTRIST
jgi:hypothetical protein